MHRFVRAGALAGALAVVGCSDDGSLNPTDAGGTADVGVDLGMPDLGAPDLGGPDLGSAPDLGPQFPPGIVFRGRQRISGIDLHLDVRGNVDSPKAPVVFLSLSPEIGSEYLIEPTQFVLGDEPVDDPERLAIYVDLPAQGRSQDVTTGSSTISVEFQYEGLADIVDFIQSEWGGDRPVDLVGHGYGGLVASLLAARKPDDVNRLVLLSPYPPEINTWRDFKAEVGTRLGPGEANQIAQLTTWGTGAECMQDLDECAILIFKIQAKYWVCRPDNAPAFDELRFLNANWSGKRGVERSLRGDEYDYVLELATIDTPTTVVLGECDPSVPPECQGPDADPQVCSLPNTWELYLSNLQNRRQVDIPSTGIFPMVEDRDAFRSTLLQALDGPEPAGQP